MFMSFIGQFSAVYFLAWRVLIEYNVNKYTQLYYTCQNKCDKMIQKLFKFLILSYTMYYKKHKNPLTAWGLAVAEVSYCTVSYRFRPCVWMECYIIFIFSNQFLE